MAKRKKIKPFRAVAAVKALARERVGAPRATRREENPKKKLSSKHKENLGDLLTRDE